jgi:hypothetical protein
VPYVRVLLVARAQEVLCVRVPAGLCVRVRLRAVVRRRVREHLHVYAAACMLCGCVQVCVRCARARVYVQRAARARVCARACVRVCVFDMPQCRCALQLMRVRVCVRARACVRVCVRVRVRAACREVCARLSSHARATHSTQATALPRDAAAAAALGLR